MNSSESEATLTPAYTGMQHSVSISNIPRQVIP